MAKDIVIKGAKENNLKNVDRDDPQGQAGSVDRACPDPESLRSHLIRFTQRGRESTWKVCRPMRDSFWDRWKSLMWSISKDFHRRSLSIRKPQIKTLVPQWER